MGSLLGSWWCVEATVPDVDVLDVDLLRQQGMQAVHTSELLRERVGHSVILWLLHSHQATQEKEWSGPECLLKPLSQQPIPVDSHCCKQYIVLQQLRRPVNRVNLGQHRGINAPGFVENLLVAEVGMRFLWKCKAMLSEFIVASLRMSGPDQWQGFRIEHSP